MTTQTASYRELFIALVNEYNGLLGRQGPVEIDSGPVVELLTSRADVTYALRHSEAAQQPYVALDCRLGSLPPQPSAEVLLRLLQMQRALTPLCSATLSLDPQQGDLCYTVLLPLVGTDGVALHREMVRLQGIAQAWRRTYFQVSLDGRAEQDDLSSPRSTVLQ